MAFKLEKPKNDESVAEQVKSIFKLIFESEQIMSPASPRHFMALWRDGVVKVFTSRSLNTVEAVRVFMVVPDSLDRSKNHIIKSISVGESEGLDNYVDTVLEAYR